MAVLVDLNEHSVIVSVREHAHNSKSANCFGSYTISLMRTQIITIHLRLSVYL